MVQTGVQAGKTAGKSGDQPAKLVVTVCVLDGSSRDGCAGR